MNRTNKPQKWLAACMMAGGAMVLQQGPPAQYLRPVVSVLRMPYVGERNVAELSPAPDALLAGGLVAALQDAGAFVAARPPVRLSADEEKQYGAWQRLALANAHLADQVAETVRGGGLAIGLLANCSSLLGMLGGVQHADGGHLLRVGLVYIDAHADFNTPETTLSGMLGGMDVATAAGLCLTRLRTTSKLDRPLQASDIVLAGVRDTDPLEQQLVDEQRLARLTVGDLTRRADVFRSTLADLASRVDRIYVHVDMDVLDPDEVPGHSLRVAGGPTSAQLAAAVTEMFHEMKTCALGIASTPTGERDKEGRSLRAAYALMRAAVRGVRERRSGSPAGR